MLGVDVGSHSVKICCARRHAGGFRFECVESTLPHPERSHLGRWCHRRGWPVRAAAALPATRSVLRVLDLGAVPDREAGAAAGWELQRVLPYPLEEAAVDLVPLQGPGGPRWLAAAAHGGDVRAHVSLLRGWGLRPVALEPEPVALWRLHLALCPDAGAVEAVLDLGAGGTRLLVIVERAPVLLRCLPVGCRDLQAPGGFEGPLRDLLTELDHSLRFCRQTYGRAPDRIWACGGGGAWAPLLQALRDSLGAPVEPWRLPVEVLGAGPHEGSAAGTGLASPAFALAMGLCLWSEASRIGRVEGVAP